MRGSTALVLLLGVALFASFAVMEVDAAKSGGGCAGCTLAVSLIEQVAIAKKISVSTAVSNLCKYLANKDSTIEFVCNLAAGSIAPLIQNDLNKGISPEVTCANPDGLKLCKEFAQCKLFSSWPPKTVSQDLLTGFFENKEATMNAQPSDVELSEASTLLSENSLVNIVLDRAATMFAEGLGLSTRNSKTRAMLKSSINDLASQLGLPVVDHYPLVDDDGDHFSTIETLRGTDWRGRDCDDKNPNVYPGRKTTTSSDANVDHNCNGIKGKAPSGQSYEELFCSGTKQYGLIALGDSATAHFSIPPAWLSASSISESTFQNLVSVISNEADYPHCSSTTGHGDPSRCPQANGNFTSLYLKIRERNRCSHRDYQNVGVNGGSSKNMKPQGIINTMARGQLTDQPAIVMYALIGNDVCNHNQGFDTMTTVPEFTANTIESLNYLDTVLPAGSHVIMGGLVDGRVLFNSMATKMHPIGATYPGLYDYLNCLDTSPCWGWMNTNSTVRDYTTRRAADLSNVYPQLVAQRKWKNFEAHYVPTMQLMNDIVQQFVRAGRDPAELIERTDGFHPSTTAQRMLAEGVWSYIQTNLTSINIPVNPYNSEIEKVFGNQGGY